MNRIKFFSDYARSEDLLRRFRANYIVNDNLLQFTFGDDYDIAVVFNRTRHEPVKRGVLVITVIQEPSWHEVHDVKDYLLNSDYIIINDRDLFEETHQIKLGGKVIESPAYMFYHDHVDHSFYAHAQNYPKQKKLSIIMSGLYFIWGNYRKRIAVLSQLLHSDLDFDIYGNLLQINDPRYKGPLEYKYNGLLPYEYSIAIENSNEKNYITEKFVDCVLCNTIPIYNGAPNVGEVYDDRYYRTIDLDSLTIVEDVRRIIAEPAPQSTVNKDIYFNQLNLYDRLKDIILKRQ